VALFFGTMEFFSGQGSQRLTWMHASGALKVFKTLAGK
jgi:hypothetical protein